MIKESEIQLLRAARDLCEREYQDAMLDVIKEAWGETRDSLSWAIDAAERRVARQRLEQPSPSKGR